MRKLSKLFMHEGGAVVSKLRLGLAIGMLVALAAPQSQAAHHHSASSGTSSHHSASKSGASSSSHGSSKSRKGGKAAKGASSDEGSSSDAGSGSGKKGKHGRASRTSAEAPRPKFHGQQAISSERVSEIQKALIREHYLTGEPSGSWDNETIAAMQKYQSDQGWQTKLMPDSRALKKLGLGADYTGAINAKSGNFVEPPPTSSIPAKTASGVAAGSGARL